MTKRFSPAPPRRSAVTLVPLLVTALAVLSLCMPSIVLSEERQPSGISPLADAQALTGTIQPFLRKYCVACHGNTTPEADLDLASLKADFASPTSASKWVEVMDKLNLGEMPPEGEPQPGTGELTAVTRWIAAELRHGEQIGHSAGGRVVLRRMNRAEYANTIRDLLAMEFLPGEGPLALLPPDGTAEGFNKVSTALTLDPSLLEKYFAVARQVADKVIVDGPPPFATEVMRYEMEEIAQNRAIDYLCTQPGITCRENDIVLMQGSTRSYGVMKYPGTNDEIPVKGTYRIRVRAWGEPGADGEPVIMRVQQSHPQEDQQLLIETEVTAEPQVYEIVVPRDPKCGEYRVSIVNDTNFGTTSRVGNQLRKAQQEAGKAKDFARVMRLQSRQQLEALVWGRPNPDAADRSSLRRLIVDWIECEGPLYDQWPPKSHQRLLFRGADAEENLEYAEAIFERFMRRAFRRPVAADEVGRIVSLVEDELKAGEPFRDAVGTGVVAVLCSPKFLYIVEPSGSESPRPLNDWELASRLSYFLWSSMPDEELFELAEAGRLGVAEVLDAQVDRMLADEKAQGFVEGFGAQWLRTDQFLAFTPDARLYPQYDEELGAAMVGEPLSFFEEVLRRDESVLSFIDSDWTMLNERLAAFYGIEGVRGDAFQRVSLPSDSPRGGVLAMAGVALHGSDGNRTKPVHRGVYVRDVLFNDPPNPPPPNVGEVEPNIEGENLTVRQRLIQHQQIASCAACHKTIDCYGLALENFNAIGAWRTQQDGEDFRPRNAPAIDASGMLPDGQSFESFEQFKALMLAQKSRFARGLTEKILIYALGRPLGPSDRTVVDRLAEQMAEDSYTLRSLIHATVTSEPFLTK